MGNLFGKRLRELREARSLTQATLARDAGLGKSYISGLELGRRPAPRRNETLERLARALGVSGDSLLRLASLDRLPAELSAELQVSRFIGPAPGVTSLVRESMSDAVVPLGSPAPLLNAPGEPYPSSIPDDPLAPTSIPVSLPPGAFCVTVADESMEIAGGGGILRGDLLVLEPGEPFDGGVGLILHRLAGRTVSELRQVFRDDPEHFRLQPWNLRFPASRIRRKDLLAAARVVGRYTRV